MPGTILLIVLLVIMDTFMSIVLVFIFQERPLRSPECGLVSSRFLS